MTRLKSVLLPLCCCLALGGCASWLPRAQSESSPFQTFEDARVAIDSLTPMVSTTAKLSQLGLDPLHYPNTVILAHPDIVRRFVPSGLLQREDLDAGVRACLAARESCRGWEITANRIQKQRTGNFWADFTNFSRRSETTGWRFNALVLLIDDLVVYRAWGGQPKIRELEVSTNPLGPLQDIGPAIVAPR